MWASRKAKCPSLQAAAAAYVLQKKNVCTCGEWGSLAALTI